jgi:multimeric flavodoxin WrbA
MAPEARPKVKIAFVYYSMYGHIKQLVDTAAKAIEDTYGHGVEVKTFTV